MATYTGMFRSNEVEVTDSDAVEALLDGTVIGEGWGDDIDTDPGASGFIIDGRYEFSGNDLMLYSTATTFAVWDADHQESMVEAFLACLSEYLADGETLVIRSVGFTGARHIPDAFQVAVTSDGEVQHEQLTTPMEVAQQMQAQDNAEASAAESDA